LTKIIFKIYTNKLYKTYNIKGIGSMMIDAEKSTPKYLQLKEILKHYFRNEHYEAEQKIPSESELMTQFNVSRNTVRQALAELVNEGFIYKKAGSGSFFSGKTHEDQKDRSYLIGVITPMISYYIYPKIIEGIDDISSKKRYNIVLGNSKGSPEKEIVCLEQILEKGVDGLLLEPAGGIHDIHESKTYALVKQISIPVVFMDWVINDPECSYVSLDDLEGGFRATSHLIEAGHRQIACIYPDDHVPGLQRYHGYRKALETHSLPHLAPYDKPGTILRWNDPDYIPILVQELLDLGTDRPTAIFFFNDAAALRGYTVIREAGLTIPNGVR
jgi:GntR family transcriptional regulator of arabinose operon